MQNLFLIYLILINLITFVLMGVDKKKARNNQWRISENTLWFCALLFGAIGVWLGMKIFHHKTKHTSFKIGIPILILLELIALYYIRPFL